MHWGSSGTSTLSSPRRKRACRSRSRDAFLLALERLEVAAEPRVARRRRGGRRARRPRGGHALRSCAALDRRRRALVTARLVAWLVVRRRVHRGLVRGASVGRQARRGRPLPVRHRRGHPHPVGHRARDRALDHARADAARPARAPRAALVDGGDRLVDRPRRRDPRRHPDPREPASRRRGAGPRAGRLGPGPRAGSTS